MATNMTNVPAALDEDLKVRQYISKLAELRSTGVTRVSDLKQQITATKKSKMLSSETKTKLIEDCKKQIAVANADAASHKGEIDALTKEAVAYVNTLSAEIEKRVYAEEDAKIAAYKEEFNSKVAQINTRKSRRSSMPGATTPQTWTEPRQPRARPMSIMCRQTAHCATERPTSRKT